MNHCCDGVSIFMLTSMLTSRGCECDGLTFHGFSDLVYDISSSSMMWTSSAMNGLLSDDLLKPAAALYTSNYLKPGANQNAAT